MAESLVRRVLLRKAVTAFRSGIRNGEEVKDAEGANQPPQANTIGVISANPHARPLDHESS